LRVTIIIASQINRGTFFRGFYLSKYLAARGHAVTLLCSGKPGTKFRKERASGFDILTLPSSDHMEKWLITQLASVAISCIRNLVTSSDIVHVFQLAMPSTLFVALFTSCFSRILPGKPRVYFDWDDLWGNGGILRDVGRFASEAASIMEEKFLRLADGITVVSEYLKERASALGAKNIFLVPNGVNPDALTQITKTEARRLLGKIGQGTILCHVGFADFTHVWRSIEVSFPDVRLIVIGDPPRYNFRRLQKVQHNRIIYTGRIPPEKMHIFLSAADILLLKTNNEISEKARFPIRIGDYLAAGRPIVAGEIGEIEKIIADSKCGLLYSPGDDEDFAAKIFELLKVPSVWDEMGLRALSKAKELSWDNLAKRLEIIYSQA